MNDPVLRQLRTLTGRDDAEFRPNQREAIEALVDRRKKVLLVQRTGWGKSAVYFLSTKMLRAQGFGPTLLISPLLALMRNQIEAAQRLGLRAHTINSSVTTTVDQIEQLVTSDATDVLLISPERLANPEFADRIMPIIGRKPALIVIDEVHCISDWGHDFRPDYRRLGQVISRLPPDMPVLGCSATANNRVVADAAAQLGNTEVLRGPLHREGLSLQVVELPSMAERMAWLATHLDELPGSGVIYCLTIKDVELVADWLDDRGFEVLPYSGDDDGAARVAAEEALQANRIKALVATSALGMGYDKPDLGFVVHFQAPGSPVAYYQQVGRAGRALDHSDGVLLCGREDEAIQDWFIETAFPKPDHVDQVLAVFDRANGPVTLSGVEHDVNLKRGRIELVLKQLAVEGVLERKKGQTYQRTLKAWAYPTKRVQSVTAARRAEQQVMRDYITGRDCRMQTLARVLDDPDPQPCGCCDRCAEPRFRSTIDADLVEAAQRFLRHGYIVIEPRARLAPGGLPEHERAEEGRALCRWGDEGWGVLVKMGKYELGRFDDRLVEAAVEMLGEWSPSPAPGWIAHVPSLRAPGLVRDLAERLGSRLSLPVHHVVEKLRHTPPQKTMENSTHQFHNVDGAFGIAGPVPDTPVLLVDDLVDSRWTFTVIARLLRQAGSGPVLPLALASSLGRDS